jgi:hypothetical protein
MPVLAVQGHYAVEAVCHKYDSLLLWNIDSAALLLYCTTTYSRNLSGISILASNLYSLTIIQRFKQLISSAVDLIKNVTIFIHHQILTV